MAKMEISQGQIQEAAKTARAKIWEFALTKIDNDTTLKQRQHILESRRLALKDPELQAIWEYFQDA